jgi:hypothetical protein
MKIVIIVACALSLSVAQAWGQSTTSPKDPADPKAVVEPTVYRSAFDRYRKHREQKVESWKGANDNVGRIGGWRTYAREAQQPDPPAAGSAAPAKPAAPENTKPAPGGHSGHRMH